MEMSRLADSEAQILKQYKRKAVAVLVQAKAEALLLVDSGVDVEIIAGFVDRRSSTVLEWVREFNKTRIASVVTGHEGNLNASYLSAEQREEVYEVLSRPPSDQGLPGQFWTVPDLAEWIQLRFEVVYESPESYHFLFKAAGLSFHNPEPFDRRRAPEEEVEARMEEIRAEIAEALADPEQVVVAADEVRIDQEAVIRRAWYAKGMKTKVKVNRQRSAQSYIGFLDQDTGKCDLVRLPWQNGPEIITALRTFSFRHPGQKITIVWDNASWHRAKALRELLGPGKEFAHIHLVWMPPYSPDHNPIEHVWKDAKEAIANWQAVSFDETRDAFENHIASREFNYKI
jgi:transposase